MEGGMEGRTTNYLQTLHSDTASCKPHLPVCSLPIQEPRNVFRTRHDVNIFYWNMVLGLELVVEIWLVF